VSVATRRRILGLLSTSLLAAATRTNADTMSTLLDPRTATPTWPPPSVIPSVDVLDLAMEAARGNRQAKAQLDVAENVRETSDILALSARMMQAGDDDYAAHLGRLPKIEGRLHWLAWTLQPLNDSALAYFVERQSPAGRKALLAALREAQVAGYATAVAEMLPALSRRAVVRNGLPAPQRKRHEEIVAAHGGRARLTREIGLHLDGDPEAKAFIDRARSAIDDPTRVYFLFRAMIDHFGNDRGARVQLARLNALPIPHRVIWLLHVYRSELHNGGIEQNFTNSGGALAPETAAALRLLGLDAHAAVMEQGIALFPKPYPRDRDSPEWPADISDKLYPLGDGLNGEEVDPALAAYARREGVLPR
jgi:hypothetical protein